MSRASTRRRPWRQRLVVAAAAITSTVGVFAVLPLLQTMRAAPKPDYVLRDLDITSLPPPPPPPPPPDPEPEPEPEPPPDLIEPVTADALGPLQLDLGGAGGSGWLGSGLLAGMARLGQSGGAAEAGLGLDGLEQAPRPIAPQASPALTGALRRKLPAEVLVRITVGPDGSVEGVKVLGSSDPDFEASVTAAVERWKYEPGIRNGKPDRFRLRQNVHLRRPRQ